MRKTVYAWLTIIIAGCSAQMVELSAPMTVIEVDEGVYHLKENVTIQARNAEPIKLRAGTNWRHIGTIEQGNVFDTKDQVVIINAFDVHEAALVTKDGYIKGFYLKASKTFVEAQEVPIKLTQ